MKVTSYLVEAHIFRQNNNKPEFLLLKRAGHKIFPGVWQMITGNIDEGEKAFETALREMKEETGLTPSEFWIVPSVNSFYSDEKDLICIVPVFAARVETESEIIISEEHTEYRWVDAEEAKKFLAWEGQRKSVDIIYEYFTNQKSYLEFVKIALNNLKK